METATSAAFANNIANTIVLNFSFQVFINLFLYTGSAAFGIFTAGKIAAFLGEQIISYLHYKLTDRYRRRMDEIKELNNKMQDRLVEILEIIDSGKIDAKTAQTRMRLLYNSSRLKKYDKTIPDDVSNLLNNLSFKQNGQVDIKNIKESQDLVDKIREKVDKLWFG